MNDALSPPSTGAYAPTAIYYEESDSVEYLREDVACVYRRVDERLTLALDMHSRLPVGFRLKGFKNFYLRHLRFKFKGDDGDFLSLVSVLEEALSLLGEKIFDNDKIKIAYENAFRIAEEDRVKLRYLPKVA